MRSATSVVVAGCLLGALSAGMLVASAEAQCPPGMICVPANQAYGGGFGGGYAGGFAYPGANGFAPATFGYLGSPYAAPSAYGGPTPTVADFQFPYAGAPVQYGSSCYGGGLSPYSFQQQPQSFNPYSFRTPRTITFALHD